MRVAGARARVVASARRAGRDGRRARTRRATRRGEDRATRATNDDFQFDPSALPTFGGGGASAPKPPGGGLIVPGMDGFDADAVVVQRNPMSGGATTAGERKGPAGVIPKVGGELQGAYEPFKPPETY